MYTVEVFRHLTKGTNHTTIRIFFQRARTRDEAVRIARRVKGRAVITAEVRRPEGIPHHLRVQKLHGTWHAVSHEAVRGHVPYDGFQRRKW